ncbi:class I SAM-dependent methyltransferase [Planococcus beijingensis]|uniref:class I SAM-dependent methyltransferase n=1 Tax=Planococcus beijingensis TaxID=2782551 RepID=UPI00193B756C|nr:class I SAM-dependent methyltransferase [Planococcus beijingensis]
MKDFDYTNFYDKIGKINGWDFSQLRVSADKAAWEFTAEVSRRCNKDDFLLDIGTGSGETLLKIAPFVQIAVGIDLSIEMIQSAKENLRGSTQTNTRFAQMSSKALSFPKHFFDIVVSRHAPFNSAEVEKVLKSDGIFITQQVSEDDKLNIKRSFGRGQTYNLQDGTLKEKYRRELIDAGFSKVEIYDDNVLEYYERPEDLLFLLQHTPIIPNFGQEENDYRLWNIFIEKNQTSKGICTNSKRFLIVAIK